MRLGFRLIATILWAASSAIGGDYFVAIDGSDANPGTRTQPFRSIQRGIAAAKVPGDNVIVRQGVFRVQQPIYFPNPGAPTRFITLRSARNEKAVIDGSDIVPRHEEQRKSQNLIGIGNAYIRVQGLTIQNSPHSGIAIWGSGRRVHHVEVLNNDLQSCFASGVHVGFHDPKNGPIDILIEGNEVHEVCLSNGPRPEVEIPEKARRLGGRYFPWSAALGGTGRRVTTRNNRVYRNYGEGIAFYLSDASVIEGNEVHDNFSVNVYLDNATNARVNGNLIHSTGDADFFRFRHPADGILVANEFYGPASNQGTGNVITNNILIGNRSAISYGSYQRGGGLRDTLIAHNTAYSATGALLRIDLDEGHHNTRIVNNIFQQIGRVAMTDIRGPLPDVEFSNNLWFGVGPQQPARSESDIVADPRLVKPVTRIPTDFQLRDDSPARQAGRKIPGIEANFDGQPRRHIVNLGAW